MSNKNCKLAILTTLRDLVVPVLMSKDFEIEFANKW